MKNGDRVHGRKGHVYHFDGHFYPSVTTIIHRVVPDSPDLKRWKETYRSKTFKSAEEYTRYSSIRGTFIHYVVLNTLSPFTLDPGDLPALSEWQQWREMLLDDIQVAHTLWDEIDIAVKGPSHIETPLCHHGLWYAGTPDLVSNVTYDGKTSYTLIDLKTSKRPYDSHFHQLGAYTQMVESMVRKNVERGLLIYLNPQSGKAEVVSLDVGELKENAAIFNEIRNEFYSIENIEKEYGLVI